MSGVSYSSTTLGTAIGPSVTSSSSGGIFGIINVPGSENCLTAEVNTSTLTPAGPYTTSYNRPVAIRIFSNAAKTHLLSVSIGFTAA
jgi:hypothetical protein